MARGAPCVGCRLAAPTSAHTRDPVVHCVVHCSPAPTAVAVSRPTPTALAARRRGSLREPCPPHLEQVLLALPLDVERLLALRLELGAGLGDSTVLVRRLADLDGPPAAELAWRVRAMGRGWPRAGLRRQRPRRAPALPFLAWRAHSVPRTVHLAHRADAVVRVPERHKAVSPIAVRPPVFNHARALQGPEADG